MAPSSVTEIGLMASSLACRLARGLTWSEVEVSAVEAAEQ